MKKLIFTLLIIHFSLHIVNAQWLNQNSSTTADMASIKFINKNTGWACGYGVILKTTNGGINWISQSHPATNKSLMKIQPLDSNTVYCSGYFQTILKTTNGGLNWLAIRNGPYGTGNSFLGMFFLNYNTGWITGAAPYILKTTNGGSTFDSIYFFWAYTRDIYFKDSLTGLVSGEGGLIRKSTDGGYNWFDVNINLYNQGYDFVNLSVINNQYVWIIGRQVYGVYHSTDFGNNFDSVGYVTGGYEIYNVRFINNQTGWCGGGGTESGRMFRTTDSGRNWIRLDNGANQGYVSDIYFHNDTIGWAVGGDGMIKYTTNGGISYVKQVSSIVSENFKLYQNYPNPFNQITNIKYQITKSGNRNPKTEKGFVAIKAYDLLGKEVLSLINGKQTPGIYEVSFDCGNLSTGVYFYSLLVDGKLIDTKKLVLIK
jgi:photosystem II stability/assembly factor-like uncharacterized protein